MSSRTRSSGAAHAAHASARSPSRGGRPSLSERQTLAYLAARDVLRRIQRTHTLVLPSPKLAGQGCDRTWAHDHQGRACA